MLWIISCVDNPNTAATRAEVMQAHRSYMQAHKDKVVLAGPTQTDDGAQSIGSLFVINVNSRAEAKAFFDDDPFTKAAIFASSSMVRLLKGQWNPQVGESA